MPCSLSHSRTRSIFCITWSFNSGEFCMVSANFIPPPVIKYTFGSIFIAYNRSIEGLSGPYPFVGTN